ncbi:hypothetical protein VTN00DRAFT_6547 [Thermoascus crustaceus]|uniref:uncharacterized protein n=1 Tax=Thermoascus crustaceus TaxID=5088 RepID=UPI003744225E
MANVGVVVYNIAVFVSNLFLLEFGADKFIDHTAVVARRTGISETVIGLITAGGEWEELAVVVASLIQGRSSLAIGNIVGSAISNILGAFSLGLLFHEKGQPIQFDRSSRIYSILLLIVTTFVTPITYFSSNRTVWLVGGAISLAIFAVYIASIGVAIGKGILTAPEDSDDDDDDDDADETRDDGGGDDDDDNESFDDGSTLGNDTIDSVETSSFSNERTGLLRRGRLDEPEPDGNNYEQTRRRHHKQRSLFYHLFHLKTGLLAICLAGYILSHSATTLTDEFGISDVVFGVIVLAIATTLPEKFVAVLSGHKGQSGILVANTAGSNIFLLALCAGIVMLDSAGKVGDGGNVSVTELGVLWGSTLAFTLTVWFGARVGRWIGGLMVVAYVVFIVLDFTVIVH